MASEQAKRGSVDRVLITRLAVGLIQGALFYWTADFRADKPQFGVSGADWPHFIQAAWTFALLAPLPLLFGLGNLPVLRLAIWSLAAAAGLVFVGAVAPAPVWTGAPPVVTVWVFSLIVIYIVHEFIQAAHDDRRPVARFETYFDVAWRHGFQAVLALIFIGAFWIVLWLGAWLFNLIGVEAFEKLIGSDEFYYPASSAAFALALHWTDAGSGMTRGARAIGLALLSWLAILLTLILTAFLAALPFTGLEPLWDTRRATVLLLNAAATMILLINAAFQAGEPPESRLIRAVVRFSALPLLGIVGLAAIGLSMRVGQYGLTPARVVAGAELLIVALHAVGYVAAAVRPGPWMGFVKPVNILGAAVAATILLLLMTPIADPARLSVDNQVKRLESGKVEPDDFDFGFLADARSRHWGETALGRLAAKSGSPRDERIALLAKNPGSAQPYVRREQTFSDRRASLRLIGPGEIPDAALLPPASGPDPIAPCASALNAARESTALAEEEARRRARLGRPPAPFDAEAPPTPEESRCLARRIDLDLDGDEDLLIQSPPLWREHYVPQPEYSALIVGGENGWRAIGQGGERHVPEDSRTWRAERAEIERRFAEARAVPSGRLDFAVNGRRVRWVPTRTLLSTEEMRAGIIMRGGGEAPASLLVDRPLWDFISHCAIAAVNEWGVKPACFGRYLDATGDGADEFLSLRFSAPNRDLDAAGDGDDELLSLRFSVPAAPSIQVYVFDGTGWRAAGLAEDSTKQEFWSMDPEGEPLPDYVARLRLRVVDEITTLPPLLADIEIGGARVVLDYTEAASGLVRTEIEPPPEQLPGR